MRRTTVDVTCANCGAEWPSTHPEALAIAKAADDAARPRRVQ